MFAWIAENIATLLICAALIGAVSLIIVKLVRNKKAGKSSCGCNCSCCPMAGKCHPMVSKSKDGQ